MGASLERGIGGGCVGCLVARRKIATRSEQGWLPKAECILSNVSIATRNFNSHMKDSFHIRIEYCGHSLFCSTIRYLETMKYPKRVESKNNKNIQQLKFACGHLTTRSIFHGFTYGKANRGALCLHDRSMVVCA